MAWHWCPVCKGEGGEAPLCTEGPCHDRGSCRGRPTMERLSAFQAEVKRDG